MLAEAPEVMMGGVRAAVVECLVDLVLTVLDDQECARAMADRGTLANPTDERRLAANPQGDDR